MTTKMAENLFYPEEEKKLNIISHLEEFRKRFFVVAGAVVLFSVISFINVEHILSFVILPGKPFLGDLIFLDPAEAFMASVKVSLLVGVLACFPLMLQQVWSFVAPAISKEKRKNAMIWTCFSLALFVCGTAFVYFLALPAAMKFLISFGRNIAIPMISIGRYISFFSGLILAGGIVFEIPVCMVFLVDVGILRSAAIKEKRAHALLAILVLAAVITPTQDIVNMLIFAIPMGILFEIGLFISVMIEKRNKSTH